MDALDEANDSEFSNNVYKSNMDLFFNPEIERRRKENSLSDNFILVAAQAIFFPDGRPPLVRLNEEVSAKVKIKKGTDSTAPDFHPSMDEVEGVELNESEFLDCGHSTLILLSDGYQLTFDFQYNKQLSSEHLLVAKQFLEVSKFALDNDLNFAFIDTAFSTIELLAKTNLFLELNKSVSGKSTHKAIKAEFNRRYSNKQTDFEIERREVFNKLSNIRSKARYLEGKVNLAKQELVSIFDTIEKMFLELSGKSNFNLY